MPAAALARMSWDDVVREILANEAAAGCVHEEDTDGVVEHSAAAFVEPSWTKLPAWFLEMPAPRPWCKLCRAQPPDVLARTRTRIHCAICCWRKEHIEPAKDEDDTWVRCCHAFEEFSNPVRSRILELEHAQPPPLWIEIITTKKLCSPHVSFDEVGKRWLEIPLRNMVTDLAVPNIHFTVQHGPYLSPRNADYSPGDHVVGMYHATKLESLVRPTATCRGSQGILRDGALHYGMQTHGGAAGVNYYSCNPETCTAGDGWCLLRLTVASGVRLKGGAKCRHCIKGPEGFQCKYAAVESVMVLMEDAPTFLQLA